MLKGRITNLFESNRFIDGHYQLRRWRRKAEHGICLTDTAKPKNIINSILRAKQMGVVWKPMSNTLIRQKHKEDTRGNIGKIDKTIL